MLRRGVLRARSFMPRALIILLAGVGVFLCGCRWISAVSLPAPVLTATPRVSPIPTAQPAGTQALGQAAPALESGAQGAALLPDARQDFASLAGIPSYNLTVDIDYAAHTYTGTAQVKLTNQEDVPLDRLYFRLLPNAGKSYGGGGLEVGRVTVDGREVETRLSLSDTVLEVALAEPLEVGQAALVEMDFRGEVPLDFGGKAEPEGYGIYNLSQGVLALSGWYPILSVYDQDGWNLDPVSAMGDSVYSDTALYSVEVAAPGELVLVTTGTQTGETVEGKTQRRHFASGPVRDFFMIMSPDFESVSREVDGVRVSSFYLPEHAEAGEQALEIAARSLEVFNQRFGAYPYVELDVVEAPMRNALGVEYPGVFLVASDLYAEPEELVFTIATAHEVAHQWWYNLVGNDVFAEPWLDESLATYSSNLYIQDVYGERTYQGYAEYWLDRVETLRENGEDDLVTQPLAYFESLETPGVYSGVTYNKGALFLKTLRDEIGDQAFFEALQAYYQANKYQIAQADDLLEAFELSAGRQLDELYNEWLYSAQE